MDIFSDKLWPDTRYEVMVQSYNIFGWSQESDVLYVITPKSGKLISSMASKPISIRWFRTVSMPKLKIIYRIVLYANRNVKSKIKTSFVSPCLRHLWVITRCDK